MRIERPAPPKPIYRSNIGTPASRRRALELAAEAERTRIIEKVEAKRLKDTSLAAYEAYNKALDDVLAAIREEA